MFESELSWQYLTYKFTKFEIFKVQRWEQRGMQMNTQING